MTADTIEKAQKLRVAFTKGAQRATFEEANATTCATDNATPPLKALAHKVLERNRQRNQCATDTEKQRNFDPQKTSQKLRRVAPVSQTKNEALKDHVFNYKLSDSKAWLTMISPGSDLNEAKRILTGKFGSDRLLDVKKRKEDQS